MLTKVRISAAALVGFELCQDLSTMYPHLVLSSAIYLLLRICLFILLPNSPSLNIHQIVTICVNDTNRDDFESMVVK